MQFEITLHARSNHDGGIIASFARQLKELGGEAVLIGETDPFYVESGGGKFFFEAQRTYSVTLADPETTETE